MSKKLIILSIFTLYSISCFASHPLNSYKELSTALQQGDVVRYIFDSQYAHCQTEAVTNQKQATMIGGGNFSPFNIYTTSINGKYKQIIATSNAMLIEHPKYGPVLNYIRLRVFEDNTAELTSVYYSPASYEKKGESKFTCQLSSAAKKGGVSLIDNKS